MSNMLNYPQHWSAYTLFPEK